MCLEQKDGAAVINKIPFVNPINLFPLIDLVVCDVKRTCPVKRVNGSKPSMCDRKVYDAAY